jgi:periodic tryptophan protein 1
MDEDNIPVVDADDLAQYKLDDYDEDEAAGVYKLFSFHSGVLTWMCDTATGPFSNIKGLQFYRDNNEDPYITLKEVRSSSAYIHQTPNNYSQDDEDNEREELEVLPTDNLLITAKTEDEISQLEVYVYDESSENLYVHHDLMLPNFPLCLEWLDFSPPPLSGSTDAPRPAGNFIAVGTLDPEIEIWSLDVVDPMYPDMLLGRPDLSKAHIPTPLGTGKKKKKKTKRREVEAGWHVDAVLALSWNRTHRNLLASASADHTVKLWDLNRCATPARTAADRDGDEAMDGPAAVVGGEGAGMAIRSFDKLHKDKVQSVEWNQKEPTVILTGSYDRTVRMVDTRAPDAGVGAIVGADVEALRWDPWEAHNFYVSFIF